MKDRKSLVIFFVVLGMILLVGLFCFTQLEIVPGTRWEGPSREVRANNYFALEKWLAESGIPFRILSMGNLDTILKGPEKTIFVEISRFRWNEDTAKLISWLEEGGRLYISLDTQANYQLADFMKSLGVRPSSFSDYDDDNEDDETEETNAIKANENEAIKETDKTAEENPPFLDWQIDFKTSETKAPVDRMLVIKSGEETRLVKLEIKKGALIFTGKAYFLHNYRLHSKENVNLAGELFFSAGEQGILFIRALDGERFILGNLSERGNPLALAVSIVLLIIAGFWMVLPAFGRYRPAPEKPGKPLCERFLAEGRFLKKNHALGKYIETYEKELEHLSRSRGIMNAVKPLPQEESAPPDGAKEMSLAQFLKKQKKLTEQLDKLR